MTPWKSYAVFFAFLAGRSALGAGVNGADQMQIKTYFDLDAYAYANRDLDDGMMSNAVPSHAHSPAMVADDIRPGLDVDISNNLSDAIDDDAMPLADPSTGRHNERTADEHATMLTGTPADGERNPLDLDVDTLLMLLSKDEHGLPTDDYDPVPTWAYSDEHEALHDSEHLLSGTSTWAAADDSDKPAMPVWDVPLDDVVQTLSTFNFDDGVMTSSWVPKDDHYSLGDLDDNAMSMWASGEHMQKRGPYSELSASETRQPSYAQHAHIPKRRRHEASAVLSQPTATGTERPKRNRKPTKKCFQCDECCH
ncbi:Uncharacterized protein PBTT_06401 [Plasmodiophora brassicae]|uniref:Uncharacterized protein n=1 Tax=Plasmodiophora brassicae TaxID=37360 RepID=A0A3P3YAE7_PLABS|nr:unnamed protein product [Plasmodiophora brassicae]